MPDEEIEREQAKIMRAPLLQRGREYPFCEDLFSWCCGTAASILAKVSSLVEVLRLGGSYELVQQLWT